MPSNRGKKKKAGAGDSIADNERGSEDVEKKWKAAALNMELMKEFECEGGLMIEEATDDVFVTYGIDGYTQDIKKAGKRPAPDGEDEAEERALSKKRRKKLKAREKARAEAKAEAKATLEAPVKGSPEDLAAENARLRREVEELKASAPVAEAAAPEFVVEAEPEVNPHWVEFDLHPALMKNIARLGFNKPTEVQAMSLTPAIRQRKDIVGAAETGSGKTLAFGLPILHHTLCELASSSSSATGGEQELTADGKPRLMQELRALAILPTRELAVQVRKHLNDVSEGTAIRAECIVGGMSVQKQRRMLSRRPQIVVGTPGRIFALLGLGEEGESERHDWLRNSLKGLRHLVLDEADRLVEAGHFKELDKILTLVYGSLARPQQLQTFVFSATLTLNPTAFKKHKHKHESDGGKVEKLSERLRFREPRAVHIVDVGGQGGEVQASSSGAAGSGDTYAVPRKRGMLPEQLAFREAICTDDKEKEAVLVMWLLRRFRWECGADPQEISSSILVAADNKKATSNTGGRIIIFLNAISSVLRLTPLLSLLLESPSADQVLAKVKMTQNKGKGGAPDHPGPVVHVLGLHSRMRQKDRLKRVERFRSCENAILIATDVAARGLDVKEVASVLHYQAPRNAETFVHRSGRTARAGRSGESIAVVGPSDHTQWLRLYKAAGIAKERVKDIGSNAFELSAAREAARLAADLEIKVHRLHKVSGDKSWMKKAADEAELMLDDDNDSGDEAAKDKAKLWGIWQQLQVRVRRQPRRLGAGPQGQRRKR